MGSWSMTCAFTGLPVEAGDPVRLVVLLREGLGLNHGALGDFSPVSGAIKGVYNDYGFIEQAEETPLAREIAALCEQPSFERWLEAAHSGTLAIPQRDSRSERLKDAQLTFTLIHERAWQEMLNLPQRVSLHYSIDGSMEGGEAIAMAEREIAQWAQGVPKAKEDFIHSMGGLPEGEVGERAREAFDMLWRTRQFKGIPEKGAARCLFGDTFWDSYHSVLGGAVCDRLWGALAEAPQDRPESDLRSIARDLGEMSLVSRNLFLLRKRWEPAPSGPQFGQIAAHWLWDRAQRSMVSERFEALRKAEMEHGGYDELFPAANALYEKDQLSALPSNDPVSRRGANI